MIITGIRVMALPGNCRNVWTMRKYNTKAE